MKCDVCGTKIPLGSNECSNCGFKFKKTNVKAFDATGSTHEHIRSTPTSVFHATKLNDMKVNKERPVYSRNVKKLNFSLLRIIILVAFIMILVGSISVPMFISNIPDFITEEEVMNLDEMSFEEIIDEGFDDGTLQLALDEKEKVLTFMQDKLLMDDLSSYEYCDRYDQSLYASFSVEGSYQDVRYKISCSLDSGILSGYDMNISGTAYKSIRENNKLPIDEKKANAIGEYIGIDNAFDLIDAGRMLMEQSEDSTNRYVYVNQQLPYVYINESQYGNTYSFYCSLSK